MTDMPYRGYVKPDGTTGFTMPNGEILNLSGSVDAETGTVTIGVDLLDAIMATLGYEPVAWSWILDGFEPRTGRA